MKLLFSSRGAVGRLLFSRACTYVMVVVLPLARAVLWEIATWIIWACGWVGSVLQAGAVWATATVLPLFCEIATWIGSNALSLGIAIIQFYVRAWAWIGSKIGAFGALMALFVLVYIHLRVARRVLGRYWDGTDGTVPSTDPVPVPCTQRRRLASHDPGPSHRTRWCGICLEDTPRAHCRTQFVCGHGYCEECAAQYVVSKVHEGRTNIRCPECDDVHSTLEQATVLALLPDEMKQHYRDSFGCNRPGAARYDTAMDALMRQGLVMQCRNCQHGIEKNDGCDHITCRCGAEFCWSCGADYGRIRTEGNTAHARDCPYHSRNL